MVPLKPGKHITRATGLRHDRRDLVARITFEGVYLKGQGQRWSSAYFISWAAAYDTAVKMRIAEKRREREARRKARRAA